jgi:hypothetical protein
MHENDSFGVFNSRILSRHAGVDNCISKDQPVSIFAAAVLNFQISGSCDDVLLFFLRNMERIESKEARNKTRRLISRKRDCMM